MVKYRCTKCNNLQNHDGQCDSCHLWAMQMQQLEDLKKLNRDLNVGIYGDGGCCGCTEEKRRKGFYILGCICILIGLIFLVFRIGEDANGTGAGFIGLGVIWFIAGFCCPNGCSDEYKRNNQVLLD